MKQVAELRHYRPCVSRNVHLLSIEIPRLLGIVNPAPMVKLEVIGTDPLQPAKVVLTKIKEGVETTEQFIVSATAGEVLDKLTGMYNTAVPSGLFDWVFTVSKPWSGFTFRQVPYVRKEVSNNGPIVPKVVFTTTLVKSS